MESSIAFALLAVGMVAAASFGGGLAILLSRKG